MENRVWTKEEIKNLIIENDKAVARALVAIYNMQTETERCAQNTTEHNGVGFNKYDAELLTNIADWYIAKGYLSARQTEVVRKRILKYVNQLVRIANKEV